MVKRNGEIDVLRFVFAILILLGHFSSTFKMNYFPRGWIGVEYFFLVSGYLMAQKAHNIVGIKSIDIPSENWRFIRSKVSVFYTYFLSAILIELVVRRIIINHCGFESIVAELYRLVPTISLTYTGLVQKIGLYVGNTWFLSSLSIALFILYPILLKSFEWSSKYIFIIFSLFVLGYLDHIQFVGSWSSWIGFTYKSVVHALAIVALGVSLFSATKFVKDYYESLYRSKSKNIDIFMMCIKFFCYLLVIVYMQLSLFKNISPINALLWLAIGVTLSFSGIGFTITDSKATRFLGKISLPIFIYHGIFRWGFKDVLGKNFVTTKLEYWAMILFTVVICVLLMYLTDYIKAKLCKYV